jgi:suppressor for copper-sensitivity B
VIACVVAIPCTAPFLGTAATFAIQGSVTDLFLIFFAIATGFSVPYFTFMFFPIDVFVKFAPYGNAFKKIATLGVFMAFLWFFWLLSKHLSPTAIKLYVGSFVGITALLHKRKYLLLGIGLAICLGGWLRRDFADFSAKIADPFENIETLLQTESRRRVIIFNITADWCLTCKYNRRVFYNAQVLKSMKDNNVKFIEADITKKNDSLIKFISNHNRVGIPFSIVYGPRAPNSGILLNEILTEDAVLEAIEKAKR